MTLKCNNVANNIFDREIQSYSPGTTVNNARKFYEYLVPNFTIFNVECPDYSFRKFTDDGLYLVSFSRCQRDVIVYRPKWPAFSYKAENCSAYDLNSKFKTFGNFFTQLYRLSLASENEIICKDFFLYMDTYKFGLFASSSAQILDTPTDGGAIEGYPCFDKIMFHLVRLEDGTVLDKKLFRNDFVHLTHSIGTFLYDNLLAILSIRYQVIHIFQISECGNLVNVKSIGEFCREDDELFLSSSLHIPSLNNLDGNHPAGNPRQNNSEVNSSFIGGLKQRLLSFVFRGIWADESNQIQRSHYLRKKFFFYFQEYSDLAILKVQFLDRHHLLIKFGSSDGGVRVLRNLDNFSAFFAVYNMDTTEFVAIYETSSSELFYLFKCFGDHFRATSTNSMYLNFVSSHSNNVHLFEQLEYMKHKSSNISQFIKKTLASLPFSCQSQSPSPYFDKYLFCFDDKLVSATDRQRPSVDIPIKFLSRRKPSTLKFKIRAGSENGMVEGSGGGNLVSSFLFHPHLPLVISIQQGLLSHSSVVNIHFRGLF